jgi:hypothetical protein
MFNKFAFRMLCDLKSFAVGNDVQLKAVYTQLHCTPSHDIQMAFTNYVQTERQHPRRGLSSTDRFMWPNISCQ